VPPPRDTELGPSPAGLRTGVQAGSLTLQAAANSGNYAAGAGRRAGSGSCRPAAGSKLAKFFFANPPPIPRSEWCHHTHHGPTRIGTYLDTEPPSVRLPGTSCRPILPGPSIPHSLVLFRLRLCLLINPVVRMGVCAARRSGLWCRKTRAPWADAFLPMLVDSVFPCPAAWLAGPRPRRGVH